MRDHVASFLASLARESTSPHTIRNYGGDLDELLAFLTPQGATCPEAEAIDLLALREWLASLYERGLSPVTIRRKVATLRSFFRYLQRSGVLQRNVATLLRIPKAPRTLPRVMTQEHSSNLLDGVPERAATMERPFPERDLCMLELLYGTGVRVSELCGLSLPDLDMSDGWLLVRGKGNKERQVPVTARAIEALRKYLAVRSPAAGEAAVFVNHRGRRISDRSVRSIVKMYSAAVLGDSSIHPHSFRHAYATHLLASGADLRAIQELLGHATLSTTQKYTEVALADLVKVYDKAHPKA